MTACDVLILGVGGQGVVTLGGLIAQAAMAADISVSFVPSKGMAQRGGFVRVEVRLGRDKAGPRIGEHSADLVVAMERSESLKGVAYVRPDGRFLLYDHVWEPTGVMLGQDAYPPRDAVIGALAAAADEILVLDPAMRPSFDGRPVAANVFVLGAMFGTRSLSNCVSQDVVESVLLERWPNAADANLAAFRAGLDAGASVEEDCA